MSPLNLKVWSKLCICNYNCYAQRNLQLIHCYNWLSIWNIKHHMCICLCAGWYDNCRLLTSSYITYDIHYVRTDGYYKIELQTRLPHNSHVEYNRIRSCRCETNVKFLVDTLFVHLRIIAGNLLKPVLVASTDGKHAYRWQAGIPSRQSRTDPTACTCY